MYIKWVHTDKAGVINLYAHTRTSTRMCPFSFLRINLRWFQLCRANNNWHKCLARARRPYEIFKTVWHVFSALFIGSEMSMCMWYVCLSSLSAPSRLHCSCDVWQTRLQCLSNRRWSSKQCLPNCCPESISENRLRGGWKLNLANVYFV